MRFLQARVLCAALLLSGAGSIRACLWDNDTLRHESEQFPGLIEVATGWFERNPPLYYQMRLDRMKTVIAKSPGDLEAYDNAAVATDRLGDDKSALMWIAKKKEQLQKLDPGVKTQTEHWYRFFANEGTFYAHLWIRSGKRTDQKQLLEHSISDLEQALKINPQAHFGREAIQLGLLKSMRPGATERALDQYFAENKLTDDQILKGLQGLVVLGNAWESASVFALMSIQVPSIQVNLRNLLSLRAQEIGGPGSEDVFISNTGNTKIRENFTMLRQAAEAERQRRDAFMLAKLKRGLHPDTDPTFWDGFVPAKPPEFIESTPNSVKAAESRKTTLLVVAGIAIPILGLVVLLFWRSRTREGTPA